jgi:TolA-binding protein
VQAILRDHFVPVRVHVRDQKDEFRRLGEKYNSQWTPTILVLDADGQERHRIEGFLPADDFAAQLLLGLAKGAFARGDFARAEPLYRQIVDVYPKSEAAAEALYWAGVSKYKASGDASALGDTARAFTTQYTDSAWAKKSSVWRS